MTPEQTTLQIKRFLAEESMIRAQMMLGDITRLCINHHMIKGRMLYSPRQEKVVTIDSEDSVSCAVCGVGFGWFCPSNPKQYCEYGEHGEDCIHCGQPSERK